MQSLVGELKAARHHWLLRRWLRNGEEVWRAYRSGEPVPVLHFRSGLSLAHGPDDAPVFLFLEVFANGCYREALQNAPAGTVIDIGANIGAFTLQAVARSGVHVHAYEPHPRTAAVLRRNIVENGFASRVSIHEEAVGRGSGSLVLQASGPSLTSSAYTCPEPPGVAVPCVGFDAVIERAGAISVVKIDAEGAEADILDGASREALRAVPRLVLECHDWLVPDATARVTGALHRAGLHVDARPHGHATIVTARR